MAAQNLPYAPEFTCTYTYKVSRFNQAVTQEEEEGLQLPYSATA